MKNIRNKILNETTNFCFECKLREKCIENECVIFRIEEIIEDRRKSMQENQIGQIIAKAREKKGISQRKLARIANLSNTEICRIESGYRETPKPQTLRKISQHIGVNYNDLMGKIGLGIEVKISNPFIKNYYKNLNMDQLDDAEINVLSNLYNLEQLIDFCKEQKQNKDITEDELLNRTIEDIEYQIKISNDTISLIQKLKLHKRIKTIKII